MCLDFTQEAMSFLSRAGTPLVTTAVLSQGNRAMQRVFPTPNLSSIAMLQVPISQGRNRTGLANMRLNIRLVIHCLKTIKNK